MSAGDVSKNDRNNKTPMSEILKSDINKNRENKNKDELYSDRSSKNKLEENSSAAAVKFAQKSDSSVENNQKNHEKNKVNKNRTRFFTRFKKYQFPCSVGWSSFLSASR